MMEFSQAGGLITRPGPPRWLNFFKLVGYTPAQRHERCFVRAAAVDEMTSTFMPLT